MGTVIKDKRTINGMTCIQCKNKIEHALADMPGVKQVQANYETGQLDIEYDTDLVHWTKIKDNIERLGYEVSNKEDTGNDITRVISLLVIMVSIFIMLEYTGVMNLLVPGQLADRSMGYGMLFVTGLVTSVHCIAMCGGIHLSQLLPQDSTLEKDRKKGSYLFPTFLYNLGRILSYTVIGFVLGAIGMLFGTGMNPGFSGLLQGTVKILAGMYMVLTGVNMLNLAPPLRRFSIHISIPFLTKIIKKTRINKTRTKKAGNHPFIVGILNGFMPCGPLQSIQLIALATGNPIAGAGSMLMFSLGTLPLMLGFGTIVSFLGKKFSSAVMGVGSILVAVLGFSLVSQGSSLSGWFDQSSLLVMIVGFCLICIILNLPFHKNAIRKLIVLCSLMITFALATDVLNINIGIEGGEQSAHPDYAMTEDNGVQVVRSTLKPGQYPSIEVKAGQPVKWIITAPEGSINGCNYKMILNSYGIDHEFSVGENTVEFTPDKTGSSTYSCWMGMIRAVITVK